MKEITIRLHYVNTLYEITEFTCFHAQTTIVAHLQSMHEHYRLEFDRMHLSTNTIDNIT